MRRLIDSVLMAVACYVVVIREAVAQPASASISFVIDGKAAKGDSRFGYITAALVTRGGLIAVADGRTQRVRLFERSGRLVKSVGRSGDGPGEFKGLWDLGECVNGMLYAYDRVLQRLTVIPVGKGEIRVQPITRTPTMMVCDVAGAIVLPQMPDFKRTPVGRGARRLYSGDVELVDASLRTKHVLSDIPIGEIRTLGQLTHFAVAGEQIAIATGDSAWVDVYNRAGTRAGGFRAGVEGRKPSVAQYTAAAEAVAAPLADASQRRTSVDLMLKQPMPAELPPYAGIVGAGDAGFWVVEGFSGDSGIRVVRFDATLKRRYDVTLPPKVRVLAGTQDLILGAVTDEDGQERIVGYSVKDRR